MLSSPALLGVPDAGRGHRELDGTASNVWLSERYSIHSSKLLTKFGLKMISGTADLLPDLGFRENILVLCSPVVHKEWNYRRWQLPVILC